MKTKKSFIDLIGNYNFSIYGEHEVEPVISKLISSYAVDRLRRIQQHGPDCWIWPHANITRFEHSLGVMLLLKRFGASLEEQVAGLLHDVSHGAFSHAVDFIYDNQLVADFADKLIAMVVRKSDIPTILERYGFDLERIFQSEHYPLLERSSPDLCADRIDYFFRDSHRYGIISEDEIHRMIGALAVVDNQFVFTDEDAALLFGTKYLESAEKVFGSKESIFFHTMIAKAIKRALEKGLLTQDDLFQFDDIQVKEKLLSSGDSMIAGFLDLISDRTVLEHSDVNPDYQLNVKVRVVDPLVRIGKSNRRLSEIDEIYKVTYDASISKQTKGYSVKVRRG